MNKGFAVGTLCLVLCMSAAAADFQPLSKSMTQMFGGLYKIFPRESFDDPQQPAFKNESSFDISVWATDDAPECRSEYASVNPNCKTVALYVYITTDTLGGDTFAFRTRNGYHWSVLSIKERAADGAAPACALITLRERVPAAKAVPGNPWAHRETTVCVSPTGFSKPSRPSK